MTKYLILLIILCGCRPESAQPVLHKQLGQKWMMIPAGTRIGNITTERPGVYFRDDIPANVIEILSENWK